MGVSQGPNRAPRVLVMSENNGAAALRLAIRYLFTHAGCVVDEATDASEATAKIQAAASANPPRHYDIAILDNGQPADATSIVADVIHDLDTVSAPTGVLVLYEDSAPAPDPQTLQTGRPYDIMRKTALDPDQLYQTTAGLALDATGIRFPS